MCDYGSGAGANRSVGHGRPRLHVEPSPYNTNPKIGQLERELADLMWFNEAKNVHKEAELLQAEHERLRAVLEEIAQWFHHDKHIYARGTSPEQFTECRVMPCPTARAALGEQHG